MDEETYNKKLNRAKIAKQASYERHLIREKSSVDYMRREAINEVRIGNRSGSHVNCLRLFVNNTWEHELMKVKVFWALRKLGHDVITEPIFNNNARADLVDCDTHVVYEILCSETEKMLAAKEDYYPSIFEIRKISANKPFDEGDLL